MTSLPNYDVIYSMVEELHAEFDLESRLPRYKSLSPELIQMASEQGLNQEDDASRALFLADFIITSSEVPPGITDEDRRKSIIHSFKIGLEERTDSSDKILKVFYLSQKVAQAIRRNDYFLAGRGLHRDASLVVLKDLFMIPFLEVAKKILGSDMNIGWEVGVLSSAMLQENPDLEIEKYTNNSKDSGLLANLWSILKEFEKKNKVELNDTLSIPNSDSQLLIFSEHTSKPNLILSNVTKMANKKENDLVHNLLKYLKKTDANKSVLYFNGNIVGSDDNLIMVRDQNIDGKPVALLKTKADEVNVSEMLGLLKLKSLEGGYWQEVHEKLRSDIDEVIFNADGSEKTDLMEEYEYEDEITVEKEVEEEYTYYEEEEVEEVKKVGFFSKLFGKKQSDTTVKVIKKVKKVGKRPVVKKVKQKVIKIGKRPVKKEKLLKKANIIMNVSPEFVGDAFKALALGNLDIFDQWDTVRESDYKIVGTLFSNFNKKNTSFFNLPELGEPEDLANILGELDIVIEKVINHYFRGEYQVKPSEILFQAKNDILFLITFDGDEKKLVGTIAVTYVKDITNRNPPEIFKRRSLKMKTGQLLSSIAHTPFDTSVERIYKNTFNGNSKQGTIGQSILDYSG